MGVEPRLLPLWSILQAINRHTEAEMQYTGVVDAVRRMLADEGLAGFYKGGLVSGGLWCGGWTRAGGCEGGGEEEGSP